MCWFSVYTKIKAYKFMVLLVYFSKVNLIFLMLGLMLLMYCKKYPVVIPKKHASMSSGYVQ